MSERVCFTYCKPGYKTYRGANGHKKSVYVGDDLYMLKFPHQAKHNPDLHYSNDLMSEHLGSSIFNILGIKAQETILGYYSMWIETGEKKTYDVVACKDFADLKKGRSLVEFAELKNEVVTSSSGGYNTNINEIEEAISKQTRFDQATLREFFWDMFVVDAYIGNFDRHNGNWGFVNNFIADRWEIAPVFDCGSCLYPQSDDNIKREVMTSDQALKIRIYQRPFSALSWNGQKVNYLEFLSSGVNDACTRSLLKMSERIEERKDAIVGLLEETQLSQLDREFYAYMLDKRKEMILDEAVRSLRKNPTFVEDLGITKARTTKGLQL